MEERGKGRGEGEVWISIYEYTYRDWTRGVYRERYDKDSTPRVVYTWIGHEGCIQG